MLAKSTKIYFFNSGINFLLPYNKGFGIDAQFWGNELATVPVAALCLVCLSMSLSTRTKIYIFPEITKHIFRLSQCYLIFSINGRIFLSYCEFPKFITIRFFLHLVRPVYSSSSNAILNVVSCSYFGSIIRNTTSLSQPLNEFIVEILIVPLFIQK